MNHLALNTTRIYCYKCSTEHNVDTEEKNLQSKYFQNKYETCYRNYIHNIKENIIYFRSIQHQDRMFLYKTVMIYINMPLNAVNEVGSIIEPLKPFGINTFTFRRIYKNGYKIYLSNDENWIRDYFQDEKYNTILMDIKKIINNFSNTNNIYRYIDSNNRLILLKYYENYVEFFIFSSTYSNRTLISLYLNNFDLFEAFTVYFEDRADKHISLTENKNAKSRLDKNNKFITKTEKTTNQTESIRIALNSMKVNQYKFKNNGIKISSREIECIASYQAGLTAKESAKLLNISYRTIEKYFDNIKEKLNCSSKKEIVKLLVKDGFPRNILCSSSL